MLYLVDLPDTGPNTCPLRQQCHLSLPSPPPFTSPYLPVSTYRTGGTKRRIHTHALCGTGDVTARDGMHASDNVHLNTCYAVYTDGRRHNAIFAQHSLLSINFMATCGTPSNMADRRAASSSFSHGCIHSKNKTPLVFFYQHSSHMGPLSH